jgi:hypothetical protein
MFPTIPENLEALSSSELRALAADIRVGVEAVLADAPSTEQIAEAREFIGKRKEIVALAKTKDALAAEFAEMSEEEEAAPVAEEVAAEAEPVAETEPEEVEELASKKDDDEEAAEHDEDEEEDDEMSSETPEVEKIDTPEATEASVNRKVRTSMGVADSPSTEVASGRLTADKLLSRSGVDGKAPGQEFGSWLELAESLQAKASQITRNSSERFQVAYVPGKFDDAHTLSDNMVLNLRKFEPEIMAEMCAPAEPQYDLDCWNTDRRPVRNSMAAFKPDARGAVTIYPSPSLSDITNQAPDGVGIWDNDRDTDLDDPKTCAVIECAEPTLYRLYGVYRCLTVQNLLAITFPELVEAYLNRLAAAHARLAETQLLEAMGTGSVTVDAGALGYGTSTSVTTSVMNLLALHQEAERWDIGGMEAWMPRWVAWAMKMDLMRRRNTSGGVQSVPSDAEITRMFTDMGVTPHFFIDTPSWATAIPAVQTGGTLNLLPSQVEMIIAPTGKFAVMDRGELSIGVTGNNIYRDNTSNSLNQFTFFFENFEALVDTNSCPAYLLEVPGLCHNGVQIDDAVIACDGTGEGS